MATSIKIEDIDLGWKATKRTLASLDEMRVSAGLFDGEQAAKGAYNEFGTSRIPSRPWLSVAADANAQKFGEIARSSIGSALNERTTSPQRALSPVGRFMRDAAKAVIEQQQVGGPPLAQSTIDRKGHADKLRDSGDMLKAIDFEIEKDEGPQ